MKTVKIKKKKNKRADIFGYPVDITNRKKSVSYVLRRMKHREGIQVVTINPEMIAAADKTPELAEIIRKAELVIPDSTGIMLAFDSLSLVKARKIPGIEFAESLMKKSAKKGFKVAFLGGSEELTESLETEIKKLFPKLEIAFLHHGFFADSEEEEIISKLKEADPHLLFVGLGTPKQEIFIDKARSTLDKTVMVGVGGSFDIWAKKLRRAPVLFRIFGIEWLYRLITQPKRVRRMFPTLPLFFLRILFDRSKLRKEYEYDRTKEAE